ncbi:MAG: hypothetical protein AAF243_14620 [Cyanobacteria bacterium P01_A01_bin.137]
MLNSDRSQLLLNPISVTEQWLLVRVALETCIKASNDTFLTCQSQTHIYNLLYKICKKYDADFWPWYLTNGREFIDKNRDLISGFWDEEGEQRLYLEFLRFAPHLIATGKSEEKNDIN